MINAARTHRIDIKPHFLASEHWHSKEVVLRGIQQQQPPGVAAYCGCSTEALGYRELQILRRSLAFTGRVVPRFVDSLGGLCEAAHSGHRTS